MNYPIKTLKEAMQRLNQYQIEDRPLNLDESRQVRDLLQGLLLSSDPVVRFAKTQRMPTNVALALQNMNMVIG